MIAMLSGLATPVEMKMKLIPSLRHMHHDANTAAKVDCVFLLNLLVLLLLLLVGSFIAVC
jgi:hypothetical protein